jgi:hypothetical protein
MAKSPKNQSYKWEEKLKASWPLLFGLAIVSLVIAYGFASWAIDSGNLLHYVLAIAFILLAFKEIKNGIRVLLHK